MVVDLFGVVSVCASVNCALYAICETGFQKRLPSTLGRV